MKNLPLLTSITPTDTLDDLVARLPKTAVPTHLEGAEMVIDENAIATRFGTTLSPSDESLIVEFDDEGGVVFAELSKPFPTVRRAKAQALKIGHKLLSQQFALDGLERSKPAFRTTFHHGIVCQYQTWIVGERQTVDVVVWSCPNDAGHDRAFVCVATHITSDAEGQDPRPRSASYPIDSLNPWAGWEDVGDRAGVDSRNRAYHAHIEPPTAEEWAAMVRPDDLDEPTMDEVLASIRQVISEDPDLSRWPSHAGD